VEAGAAPARLAAGFLTGFVAGLVAAFFSAGFFGLLVAVARGFAPWAPSLSADFVAIGPPD
jgi:ammonia channel protein AmtB